MTRGATVYGRGVIEPRGWLFIHSAYRVFVELQSGKQMGAGHVLCLPRGEGVGFPELWHLSGAKTRLANLESCRPDTVL